MPAEEPEEQRSSVPDALPLSGADTDWREFRARLIRSQAASTSGRAAGDQVPCLCLFHSEISPCMHAASWCMQTYNFHEMDVTDGGVRQQQRLHAGPHALRASGGQTAGRSQGREPILGAHHPAAGARLCADRAPPHVHHLAAVLQPGVRHWTFPPTSTTPLGAVTASASSLHMSPATRFLRKCGARHKPTKAEGDAQYGDNAAIQ